MTTTKKPLRKKAKPKAISVIETKPIQVAELQMYHKNPRIGNVSAIAASLEESGQFKPIVVNVGTHTGRKNEILAGNHTFMGMKKLGEKLIYASFVDVDEQQATKIVLADNKTADLGTYDEKIIADLFASLPDITGTGYSQEEIDQIMSEADEAVGSMLTGLEEEAALDEARERETEEPFGSSLADVDEDDGEYEDDVDEDYDPGIERSKDNEELPGMIELKEFLPEEKSYRVGKWGIPKLRSDMLVRPEDIPANLDSWAGSACKNWPDPDQWWLYNWGIDSTSGMHDVSKVIVSFYAWDDYFENWYWNPRKYVTKLLYSKIKMMVTPNYSQWSNVSPALNLFALYRSRYVGRYAQEAGIKVIPDVIWPTGDLEFLRQNVIATLPKNVPVISMQQQTNSDQLTDEDGSELAKSYRAEMQEMLDKVQPEAFLFYSTENGKRWFQENIKYDGKLIFVETRMKKLAESRKNKEKKTTI